MTFRVLTAVLVADPREYPDIIMCVPTLHDVCSAYLYTLVLHRTAYIVFIISIHVQRDRTQHNNSTTTIVRRVIVIIPRPPRR